MQATYDVDELEAMDTDTLVELIGDASLVLASRIGADNLPEANIEAVNPQEATARSLHRILGDVPQVGLQTCRKLVSAGYETVAAIRDDPIGVMDVNGVGDSLARDIFDAVKDADADVPQVPTTPTVEPQEPQEDDGGNRVVASDAGRNVPDGAALVYQGAILATVNKTDDGFTATLQGGQQVGHPKHGKPLSTGGGLAWAIGEASDDVDDANAYKDEAEYVW